MQHPVSSVASVDEQGFVPRVSCSQLRAGGARASSGLLSSEQGQPAGGAVAVKQGRHPAAAGVPVDGVGGQQESS